VVPRTFLGPLALSALAFPAAVGADALGAPKTLALVASRVALAAVLWSGFARLVAQVANRFGTRTAGCLVAVTAVQFHYVFYSSRMLPNTFASAVSTSWCLVWCGVVVWWWWCA
jgi:alpha-1,6-mannosyltransferase